MQPTCDITHAHILLTGGAGFLGRAVYTELVRAGADPKRIRIPRSHDTDLRRYADCEKAVEGIDVVIHLAATVGGIGFNKEYPGTLFYDNLMMGVQLMEAARLAGVKKFVAVGTVCAYPKFAPIPFKEEDLWNGYPEETNAPYGLAKKMLLVQAQAYRAQYGMNAIYLLPVNLYGPGDTFDPERSHVLPALVRRVDEAIREGADHIDVWGTGKATREFLYVDDAAQGIIAALLYYDGAEPVNLGAGEEISIRDLATHITDMMDFKGELRWLTDKPDGQPRRKLDTTRAKQWFGFEAQTPFHEGLKKTISWYREHREEASHHP
jgi:GDP-L-fucose synthase